MPTFHRMLRALFPVHTRRGLLVVTLSLQAVILAIGLLIVFDDIRHRVALRLEDRILEQNTQVAESLARTMDDLGFGAVECGSMGREKAQKMIEELKLPAGGFVCLLDDQDKIVCHPRLRADPMLCGIDLREMEVTTPGSEKVDLGKADRSVSFAGRAQFLDGGTHYLARVYVPSLKASVVVQQPESGLLAFGEAVSSGSMVRSGALGALALAMTGTVSFVLIRRHNRVLEDINRGLEGEIHRRVDESLAARHSIIIGLAKLAESRDTDTGEHLERIARYTELLARNLDLGAPWINDRWIEQLKLASSLHDIGKVGIPDSVLLKPGKLTPEERTIMETHAAIGAETLQTVRARLGTDDLLTMSVEVARSHHERWDGRGYPDRIAGEAIPLAARIVALADVYDALTSARVYKAPMSHSAAVAILREGEGTHFDPQVVRAFNRVERAFDRVREELQPGMPLLTDAPTTQPARLAA